MNPISITATGGLGVDPRKFTTRDGTAGVELLLAVEVLLRGTSDSISRWVKVTSFGHLASRTAASAVDVARLRQAEDRPAGPPPTGPAPPEPGRPDGRNQRSRRRMSWGPSPGCGRQGDGAAVVQG
jgi:hypothetical protein